MKKVYIIAAKRTPIGSFLGTLSTVHPSDFAAGVVKNILDKTKVPKDKIDELILGNILPAGLGQGLARQVAIKVGLPQAMPAYGVNMVCGSGMKTIMNGFMSIQAGFHDLVIAGGAESMSQAPYIIPGRARQGLKFGNFEVIDHMVHDALTDAFNPIHMGITAENIVDKFKLTRESQDALAYTSQQRAIKAIDDGKFKDEIVPITVQLKKQSLVFDEDEYPNRKTTPEVLQKLRPAFKKDGSVTAGNASGINDGASFVLLASEDAFKRYQLEPLAEIVGIGQGGVDPNYMGLGPVPAIEAALKHSQLSFDKIELFELNEAFAAQALGVLTEIKDAYRVSIDSMLEITNVNGGSIALGHPVGASGNRITVTLLHELLKRKNTYGLASLCIGGGMGTAIILKNSTL